MNIVAVIPARGGSKTIPLKNLKVFAGKPLIAWSILAAKKSKHISRVIVSTDHPEIAKVAKKYGAEVPFLRPAQFAAHTAGIEPVLKHTYEWLLENENYKADALILLMPTTPTRQSFHIDDAVKIFKKTKADSVLGVNETPANHTPYWTLTRSPSGKVVLWGNIPLKKILTRRQDFPQKCYARNDLVYVFKPKNLYDKQRSNIYGNKVELYEVSDPAIYEMDINTPDEWAEAELKFKKLILQK
ncbi:MAG: acylneuraminate cytidylyltransferase family protein [Candidatus Yanofskybacteria bacterium]|nr:acylneuraminate cytidylyltransferase family protein [Candidatus Yanofskybacteria bacterium]